MDVCVFISGLLVTGILFVIFYLLRRVDCQISDNSILEHSTTTQPTGPAELGLVLVSYLGSYWRLFAYSSFLE